MSSYRVVFSPEALEQLNNLFEYIASSATPIAAAKYVEAIIRHCDNLRLFPLRGTARDDIRSGIRTSNYKKSAVIAFDVENDLVTTLGIFYGGRDYKSILRDPSSEDSA